MRGRLFVFIILCILPAEFQTSAATARKTGGDCAQPQFSYTLSPLPIATHQAIYRLHTREQPSKIKAAAANTNSSSGGQIMAVKTPTPNAAQQYPTPFLRPPRLMWHQPFPLHVGGCFRLTFSICHRAQVVSIFLRGQKKSPALTREKPLQARGKITLTRLSRSPDRE